MKLLFQGAVFLILLQVNVFAREIPKKFLKMESLTIHDGLSQGMVNTIFQDHFGFMWFGTMDGLNRYDGYRFKLYRHDTNNPNSISGNLITSIEEDSQGRLWIGTALNGLNMFDRETETFTRFQNDIKSANSLSDNRIFSIQEDKLGNIWVGTAYGLNKLVVKKKSIETLASSNFNDRYNVTINRIQFDHSDAKNELFLYHDETGKSDYFEPTFYIDSKNVLWVGTANKFFRIRLGKENNNMIEELDFNKYNPDSGSLFNQSHIYNYVEDTLQSIIYLTRKGYVTVIDQNSGSMEFIDCNKKDLAFFRSKMILNERNVWAATEGGLYEFDLRNQKVWSISPKSNEQVNMINFSNTVYVDRSGIIWIGTKGYGILKYNPRTEKFHAVTTPSVLWLSATPENNVIAQTQRLVLYKRQSSKKSFEIDTTFFEKIYAATPQKSPDVAVQNREGTCWVNKSILLEMNASGTEVTAIPGPYPGCFPLFIDKYDNLWFGSSNSFCKLDKTTKQVKEYRYPLPKISMFPYKFLEAVLQDHDDIFWLGTINGLIRFDEKKRQWKRYVNNPGDSASLSVDIIFSICNDPTYPEKYLWIGTNGGGLNCFDKQTGKFVRFTQKDGLPHEVVYGVVNDDHGNLWLSSNKGLSRFTPLYSKVSGDRIPLIKGGTFKNFEEEDGLQSNEFNRYAFTRTTDGILFFGGVNGFNYFDPKEIIDNTIIPGVVFTDFKVNNKSVVFLPDIKNNASTTSPLAKPIFLTDAITLPHSDNMISFEFAAMDFTAPEKNLFKYKLEGFDKDWIYAGNTHYATYTNLDPGKYTFHVAGSNNDIVWNEKGASIDLTILPPWYLTWWFRLTVFIIIAASIYGLWRYRFSQALKLLEVRNRIASDLHDEIGSTLSSVYIYSEVAQKSMQEKKPEAKMYMKQISVDVANMIDSLSDIVWTVNAKNDRFENIINRMRATAVELFEASNYQLHLELDEHLNTLKLGMETRKNFYLFYKEAINNACKYADGKNVWIKLGLEKKRILLSVRDDGRGFDINSKKEGNGLANFKKRATDLKGEFEISSVIEGGTEVKLAFPYS